MSDYTIGIKLGDGSFYSVLEKNFTGKKRFVLSTVKDNQESMQIDFYQSKLASIEDAEYIGSLVIENIEAQLKGEPEIEVVLGLNPDNTLHAVASNLKSEEKQSLQVSLNNLSSDSTYDIPDFEIDNNIQTTEFFDEDDDDHSYDKTSPTQQKEPFKTVDKPKANPLLMILFILGGLAIIAGITFLIWWLVGNSFPGNTEQSASATAIPVEQSTAEVSEAPTDAPTETPAVTATSIPKEAESNNGKSSNSEILGSYGYNVKPGDTLWDLAQSAYKNPWKWKSIYQANKSKIKNPNIIFIGQKLDIPKN
ncbi:MAG: LysM peptidoglycan-binding domain-containing protein [Spirochaetales bacterium]|nr:LysM peptidoglycan-binding domain-containing protein [Spirochaetales bacterium]